MKIFGLISLLFAVLIGAILLTIRQNPFLVRFIPYGELPDGYSWVLREGPDFDVYYAEKSDDETAGMGLYLGNMSSLFFDESEDISVDDLPQEKGRLLSRGITWLIEDEINIQGYPFFRETQFEYYHGAGFLYTEVHIWVYAADQEALDGLLVSLQGLRLKPMASIWEILAHRIHWLEFLR